MAVATRQYAGVSAEERRADRRARLLEAGLDLLGTEGWPATTVRGVCARAGLTERYFYESFPNREGLLVAVFDDLAEDAMRVVLEAIEASPLAAEARARAAIRTFVDFLTDDPRKGRFMVLEAMGSEALMRRRLEILEAFSELVSEQGRAFYGDSVTREDADLTAHLLVGGMAEALISWLEGRLEVSRERLVDHFTAISLATVGVSSG